MVCSTLLLDASISPCFHNACSGNLNSELHFILCRMYHPVILYCVCCPKCLMVRGVNNHIAIVLNLKKRSRISICASSPNRITVRPTEHEIAIPLHVGTSDIVSISVRCPEGLMIGCHQPIKNKISVALESELKQTIFRYERLTIIETFTCMKC